MNFLKKSFSAKLSLKLLIYTALLFVIALGAAAYISNKLIVAESKKSAINLLDANIARIENILQSVELSVSKEAWLVQEHIDNEDYLYHITRKIVSENPNIVGSAIAFADGYFKGRHFFSPYSYVDSDSGEIKSKQLGTEQYDYFGMGWFTDPYESGKPCWSEPYFDLGGGGYRMSTFSYPVRDGKGKIFAIITADITLQWLGDVIAGIQPYPHSFAELFSSTGSYLNVGNDPTLVGETIYSNVQMYGNKSFNMDKVVESMMAGEKDAMTYAAGSVTGFVAFGSMSNDWKLAITCEYRDVLESSIRSNWMMLLIVLVSLFILSFVCYIIVRHLTRPLLKISESARDIARGNFSCPLPDIKSEDEIGQLRDSFEYMQSSLQNYISELKETTAANERFESELNIATKIQNGILPRNFPNGEHEDLYAMLKPAREVGGDLYDFKLKGNDLFFAVGDVSGKGVPAALFMAITRVACRFFADQELTTALARINRTLCDGNDNMMFVTMFIGHLNLETGVLEYCNAGHNPIVTVGADGTASFLDVKPNIAIGLVSEFKFEVQTIKLEKGSRIVLYTDGVNEAEKAGGEQFGNDALLAWAAETRELSCAEACDNLMERLSVFADGNPQNDDITIMSIDYR